MMYHNMHDPDYRCRSVQYIIYVTAYVSIYTLVLMAGDRFLAVVCPVSSITIRFVTTISSNIMSTTTNIRFITFTFTRTITNAKTAIAITWLVTLLSNSPVWLAHSLHPIGNGRRRFPFILILSELGSTYYAAFGPLATSACRLKKVLYRRI